MQVIADSIQKADAVLGEMMSLVDESWVLCEACTPLQELMRASTVRKSPPVLVAEAGKKMKEHFISAFDAEYPTVSTGIINGRLGSASYRLHDGIYKLGTCLQRMKDRKFMVMDENERKELHEAMLDVVADFAVYTIIAFQLHQSERGVCTLSVSKVCERRKVTPVILYGELLETVKRTGRTYYAYEELSPVYTDMLAAEPQFLAECEEQELPLTEELAISLLEGKIAAPQLMEYLLKQNVDVESREVDVNPISMISRMNLE